MTRLLDCFVAAIRALANKHSVVRCDALEKLKIKSLVPDGSVWCNVVRQIKMQTADGGNNWFGNAIGGSFRTNQACLFSFLLFPYMFSFRY